jgi:Ca2+-binding RTX toxin-like protein
MAQGYLVDLADGQLNGNDAIALALIGFNPQTVLGSGSWTFSGIMDGQPVSNMTATGSYVLGTNGSVYFVPDAGPVDSLSSASTTDVPAYSSDIFGTAAAETLRGTGQAEVIHGGASTDPAGTGADTILAGDGNDTVFGGDGNDVIEGGGGADSLFGGTGDDILYGDGPTTTVGSTETLQWVTTGQGNGTNLINGFTQDTGGMTVTVDFNNDGGNTSVLASNSTQFTGGTGISGTSGVNLNGSGLGGNVTTTMVFNADDGSDLSDEVQNVVFLINDIDAGGHQDIVTINAYDADGNPVAVTITILGDDILNGQTVTGAGSGSQSQSGGSILVSIGGPVHSIEIIYSNGGTSGQALWITNVQYQTIPAVDGGDTLDGGAGNDTLFGGDGNDVLQGGDDNDVIDAGMGDDQIFGGSGNDSVTGGGGNDTATLGDGDDRFGDWSTEGGNDLIYGGAGNDSIIGGLGDDTIFGDGGNDALSGGIGSDTIYGGAGSDYIAVTDDHQADLIFGGEDAGNTDTDTLGFHNFIGTDGVAVSFTGAESGTYDFLGTDAAGSFSQIEVVEGTAYADLINGTSGAGITVRTLGGDDSILGSSSADTINAGTGADTVQGGAGNDVIDLGADSQTDTLVLGSGFGQDVVSNFAAPIANGDGTFTGQDQINIAAMQSSDGLPVFAEHVAVSSDAGGNAVLTFPDGSTLTLVGVPASAVNSIDALVAMGLPDGQGVVLGTGAADTITPNSGPDATGDRIDGNDAILPGDTGNDDLIYTGNGRDTINAGTGNDEIYSGNDADSVTGGSGNDTIYAGAGNDILIGDTGDDTLFGGAGNDTLTGGDGSDTLIGEDGSDTLFGGAFADSLSGGAAADFLYGGDNDDVIDAGDGDDSVWGDAGDDTITMGDGNNVVRGGTGNDTVSGNTGRDLIYGDDGDDKITGGDNHDSLFGGLGNDSIDGGTGNDVVDGGENADLVLGGLGDDTLFGGLGEDTLFGGDGNDVLYAGSGTDTHHGESGDDRFVLLNDLGGVGSDTIFGGETGETFGDTIDASGLTEDVLVSLTAPETGIISLGRSDLTFSQIETIQLGSGNDFVAGSEGADTIFAGAGSDVILAGQGDDRIDLGGADGATDYLELQDFDGHDLVSGFEGPVDNGDGTYTGMDQLSVGGITIDGRPISVYDVVVGDDGEGNAVLIFPNDTSVTLLGIPAAMVSNPAALAAMGIPMLNYTVEGSSGDDFIDEFYVDPNGDRVDGGDALDGSDDDLILAGDGDDVAYGGAGNDSVFGEAGNDSLFGEAGDDALFGGDDDDFLNGVDGNDTLFGGAGNDAVEAGIGDDIVYGDAGDDSLNGDEGDDTVYGGDGNDYVRGSFGNDTVYGGEGDDFVWGGYGDDLLVVENNFGNDTYFGDSEDEILGDTLDLSAVTADLTIDLTNGGSESGSFSDGVSTATYTEIEHLVLGSGTDTLILGPLSGPDRVIGFAGPIANGDGTFTGRDQIDVSTLTTNGTTPVNVNHVVVSDDGNGNAVLTFPGTAVLTLVGVSPADLSTPEALNAIGIPYSDGTVTGGEFGDLIDAGYIGDAGGDRVDGGDAHLPGAAPNDDIIDGGLGDDTIRAGDGNDVLYGGQGNDTLEGQDGNDRLFGGDGNDIAYGGIGNDTLDAGSGSDILYGGEGNDTLLGGADLAHDTLYGGAGDDSLSAGGGNDTLLGGTGNDTMAGGAGDDRFLLETGFGTDRIDGGETGETQGDTIDASLLTSGVRVVLGTTAPADAESGTLTQGADSVSFSAIETLILTAHADSVTGSAGADRVDLGDGADTIDGGAGNDVINLGTSGSGGGGDGDQDLMVVSDGDGADTVYNFDGPIANGDGTYTGIDRLDVSGLTSDGGTTPVTTATVVVSANASGDAVLTFPGGESLTLIGISPALLADPAALEAIGIPVGNDGTVLGTTGNDLIDAGYLGDPDGDRIDNDDAILPGFSGNDDLVLAGAGNDTVLAGAGHDEVYGGSGNDTLQGGDGNDQLFGEADNDSLDGQGGADSLYGGDGQDSLSGGDGDDLLFGGAGEDLIDGGAGNDTIHGDAGHDTINGGTGDDLLYGGFGVDWFVYTDADFGTDVVVGGGDYDRLDLSGLAGGVTVTFTAPGAGVVTDPATGNTITFSDIEELILTAGSDVVNASANMGYTYIQSLGGNDLVTGSDGDDVFDDQLGVGTIFDGQGNDTFFGGGGNDTIWSGNDNDTLYGGSGDDRLNGQEGDDTFFGGTGNDTLDGSDGQDLFVGSDDMGNDTILGGDSGVDVDTVELGTVSSGVTVVFTGAESGTISFGSSVATFDDIEQFNLTNSNDSVDMSGSSAGGSVFGGGGADSLLGGSGDDILLGGDGADTIGGGTGNDTVDGDAGDDLLFGGAGNDVLVGDDGNDTLFGGTGADQFFGGAGNDTVTVAQGDQGFGGAGDDLFVLEDLGEPGSGTISIDGGSGTETSGDTLQLGSLADLSTLTMTDDGTGSYSGSVILDDGTLLTFNEIENIICFTPGTRIATPRGARGIETLAVGDMVVTRDHGLQPIRWIGQRTVPARGAFAPVRIRPGVVTGLEADLLVSPQHRMLFQGYRAELLFGESEVLVAAKHLIDGQAVTVETGGTVTYIHMLFDDHEIVFAEGAATESFHPGGIGLSAVTEAAREELFSLFPDLRTLPGSYGRTARRCLKRHEAALIL